MSEIAIRLIETNDVAEHNEAVFPWVVEFDQVDPGRFHGEIRAVGTEDVLVYREAWNKRTVVSGSSPAGYRMFGTVARKDAHVDWLGKPLSSALLAHAEPCSNVDFATQRNEDHLVAMVRPQAIARYTGTEREPGRLDDLYHIVCDPSVGRRICNVLESVLASFTEDCPPSGGPLESADFESEIMEALSPVIDRHPAPEAEISLRSRAFRDAVKLVQGRTQPMTVPELAAELGVSQRTLEYGFRTELGVTPLQFMRLRRLNCARRELHAAESRRATVSDIAARWGFRQPGRFAVEYGRLFAESPSATLARSPGKLGVPNMDLWRVGESALRANAHAAPGSVA